jgi:signal transduction histidine kinase/CheY-like chemotaxis protein/HPt (histidine-containing phosphotransfer) domain-containing protein
MIEEINTLKIRAEDASRAKGEFLAVMSHELRTPLNAIIGYAEILLHKTVPPAHTIISLSAQGAPGLFGDPAAAAAYTSLQTMRRHLEQIRDAGRALLSIINNILDISKIEDGNLEPLTVPYRTSVLLSEALRQSLPGIGNKPIEFLLEVDPELPEELWGDEVRLVQILNNLLSNAFKFTERGSVTLRIHGEREGEDTAFLLFEITDTGPGIKSDFLSELFTRRSRLNSATGGSRSGSGLGLVITRNLAELMGGTITVKSEYGKGSVFTAVIRQKIASGTPIGAETVEYLKQVRPEEEDAPGAESLRMTGCVLIVDDMQTNIDVARALMTSFGLEAFSASSGEEAVALLRGGERRYDMVFMDHLMPGMDGFEAARKIREPGGAYARSVPIIILTALTPDDETAVPAGTDINGFLYKPIESQKLRQILTTWMPRGFSAPAGGAAQKETAPWELFSLPGVDVVKGIAASGGTVEAYLRLLDLFQNDAAGRRSEIAAAREAGDLARYARLLRPLKSALKAIGAEAAGENAARLEDAAKAGNQAEVDAGSAGFIKELESLAGGIAGALETRPGADAGTEPAP